MIIKIFGLIIGGSVGTLARYALGGFVYKAAGTSFPYGTFIVNISGCLILGFLDALAEQKFALSSGMRTTLMIGFCGAFTTFSTLIFETNALVNDGEIAGALINIVASVIIGLLFFRAGLFLGKIL